MFAVAGPIRGARPCVARLSYWTKRLAGLQNAGRSDAGSGGDADFTKRQTTEIRLCQTPHLFPHQECLAGHPLQRCRSDREAHRPAPAPLQLETTDQVISVFSFS